MNIIAKSEYFDCQSYWHPTPGQINCWKGMTITVYGMTCWNKYDSLERSRLNMRLWISSGFGIHGGAIRAKRRVKRERL